MKWTVLAMLGSFVSDVSKMNTEKFAVITTDPKMDNAKMKLEVARDKSVNVTVLSLQPLKLPN